MQSPIQKSLQWRDDIAAVTSSIVEPAAQHSRDLPTFVFTKWGGGRLPSKQCATALMVAEKPAPPCSHHQSSFTLLQGPPAASAFFLKWKKWEVLRMVQNWVVQAEGASATPCSDPLHCTILHNCCSGSGGWPEGDRQLIQQCYCVWNVPHWFQKAPGLSVCGKCSSFMKLSKFALQQNYTRLHWHWPIIKTSFSAPTKATVGLWVRERLLGGRQEADIRLLPHCGLYSSLSLQALWFEPCSAFLHDIWAALSQAGQGNLEEDKWLSYKRGINILLQLMYRLTWVKCVVLLSWCWY